MQPATAEPRYNVVYPGKGKEKKLFNENEMSDWPIAARDRNMQS